MNYTPDFHRDRDGTRKVKDKVLDHDWGLSSLGTQRRVPWIARLRDSENSQISFSI